MDFVVFLHACQQAQRSDTATYADAPSGTKFVRFTESIVDSGETRIQIPNDLPHAAAVHVDNPLIIGEGTQGRGDEDASHFRIPLRRREHKTT